MNINDLILEDEEIIERYNLAIQRIRLMENEETVREPYRDYFCRMASFSLMAARIYEMVRSGQLEKLELKELKALNSALYEDIAGLNYSLSYANPSYACERLGSKHGKLLSFLYTELRSIIVYAYEKRLYELTIYLELLIEVYNYYEQGGEFISKDVKRAVYDFLYDYSSIFVFMRARGSLDTKDSFARDIITTSDLSDIRYLYLIGEYITDNEIKTAEYLNNMPESSIQAMADTFTEGYRRGFEVYGLDIGKKSVVNIRYRLGFERVVRCAIENFKRLGLDVTIYRAAVNVINKKQHLKIGYHSTSPNRQYDYDHRFDIGLFFDRRLMERMIECRRSSLEYYKDIAPVYGGPAVMEVYGEELFSPENKKEAIHLDKRQQKLYVEFNSREEMLVEKYYKIDEQSFTIISYPIPEIGRDFEAIFDETVKVNTLDNDLYRNIQQKIIDVLDSGEYVRIKGRGASRTDIMVKLHDLKDKNKETNFENCVADVNIPLGEVFTSPVLKGTNGVLHVPRIHLHGLEYRDLKLVFTDGMITDYSCSNFSDSERCRDFIRENLMYNHDTLPLGEFAIGTNTTAYMLGRKYDIAARFPILIAEKTGPHFAVGDTCYKMMEEVRIYNPDGKEVIARENEISSRRRTDPGKAYFNCHTDITLPYDEIAEISVHQKDGTVLPIILDSRFVLKGCEDLNEAFAG